jgi:DNA-directed RNA polymerase subunit RPC12/RpoP
VSQKNNSLYHCGRCGAFFKSSLGYHPDRACTDCGRTALLGFQITAPGADQPGDSPAQLPSTVTTHPPLQKSKPQRHKRKGFTAQLVIGWLLLLIAVIAGATYFQQSQKSSSRPPTPLAAQVDPAKIQDFKLLQTAIPLCNETLFNFLNSTTDQEQTPFISSPDTTLPRVRKFSRENSTAKIDPQTLSFLRGAVLHLPGRLAIENQYRNQDGRLLDVVFFQEDGKWRIDWDHFARFGDSPWSLFITGSTEETGEFRLLARERYKGERHNADTLNILLYASRSGNSAEAIQPSPEFIIERDSQAGRLLTAAFKLNREHQRPFGLDLPSLHPEDFINVRVKIRRFKNNDQRCFELQEVVACHWYSETASGVEISDSSEKQSTSSTSSTRPLEIKKAD